MRTTNFFNKHHGSLLRITCPFCEEEADYELVEQRPAFFLLSWLKIGCTWSVKCTACGTEVALEDDERNRALELARCLQQRREGRMNEETYRNRLAHCRLRALEEVSARNDNWTCAECDTEVPVTFDACWQCNTRNPDAPEPSDDEEAPTGLPMTIIHDPVDGTRIFSHSRLRD